jgi:hypothetical protein
MIRTMVRRIFIPEETISGKGRLKLSGREGRLKPIPPRKGEFLWAE